MADNTPTGSTNASAAIGAIAAFGMLAAPTAIGVANAQRAADASGVQCVSRAHADVERRLGGSADVAATLKRGDQVVVLDENDDHTHIRYQSDGQRRVGWIESAALGSCAAAVPAPPATGTASPSPASTSGLHANPADLNPDPATLGSGEMRAHYINVGQGVATLYEFSCGAVLVDTGGETNGSFDSDRALQAYLDEFFLARPELNRTLDLLVISHPHIDHAHGAKLVTSEYKVKNVVTDGLLKDPSNHFYSGGEQQQALEEWAKAHAKLETISTKDVPSGGKTDGVIDPVACSDQDPQLKVLWGASEEQPDGWSNAAFKDANNHSVALRIDFGKASFLTTGDLEVDAVPSLVKLHGASHALDADVWEVSHHGSANGTNQAILDAITPSIATMGTGDPARTTGGAFTAFAFGHPREDAVDLILGSLTQKRPDIHVLAATAMRTFESIDLNEALYATGWDGSIVITARADGTYSVKTEK